MIIKGRIGKNKYETFGMKKLEDGSGYFLEFIDSDPNNKEGKKVGEVFIPKLQAKVLGKFLLN